jgi:hypothetical protein
MNKEDISKHARIIWQQLQGELIDTNVNKMINECKISISEFSTARGWMVLGDKVKFFRNDKTIYIFPEE